MSRELALWNDTGTKAAIMDFVASVTDPQNPDFAPASDRIAAFDNDGTLWLGKQMHIQFQHGLCAIGKRAAEGPEVRDRQPTHTPTLSCSGGMTYGKQNLQGCYQR